MLLFCTITKGNGSRHSSQAIEGKIKTRVRERDEHALRVAMNTR